MATHEQGGEEVSSPLSRSRGMRQSPTAATAASTAAAAATAEAAGESLDTVFEEPLATVREEPGFKPGKCEAIAVGGKGDARLTHVNVVNPEEDHGQKPLQRMLAGRSRSRGRVLASWNYEGLTRDGAIAVDFSFDGDSDRQSSADSSILASPFQDPDESFCMDLEPQHEPSRSLSIVILVSLAGQTTARSCLLRRLDDECFRVTGRR